MESFGVNLLGLPIFLCRSSMFLLIDILGYFNSVLIQHANSLRYFYSNPRKQSEHRISFGSFGVKIRVPNKFPHAEAEFWHFYGTSMPCCVGTKAFKFSGDKKFASMIILVLVTKTTFWGDIVLLNGSACHDAKFYNGMISMFWQG